MRAILLQEGGRPSPKSSMPSFPDSRPWDGLRWASVAPHPRSSFGHAKARRSSKRSATSATPDMLHVKWKLL
jgi:hypothetical protein